MGILVFALAILPGVNERSIYVMRAEVPGPSVGKLVPKTHKTATVLYLIYFAMTVVEIVLLLFRMPLFDSLITPSALPAQAVFPIAMPASAPITARM